MEPKSDKSLLATDEVGVGAWTGHNREQMLTWNSLLTIKWKSKTTVFCLMS